MSQSSILNCIYKLNDSLAISGKVDAIRKDFGQINENSERVRFLLKLFEEFEIKVEGKPKLEKNNAIAESCRTKGNQFYEKKQFLNSLSSYNESLCFAESGSKHIALAYANRSAVYSELKLYEKCLKNIELAKSNHYPNLDKLKKREETCLLMINNTNSKLGPSNLPIGAEYLKFSHPANKKLPFLADCLELKIDKEFGRHIITKTALQPGDVVCCEEPFTKFLFSAHRFKYCATCLNDNYLDLFPCNDCTSTMFCSEECERIGKEKFHKFECTIIDKLNAMCLKDLGIASRTFFEALYVCDGDLEELKALIGENKGSSMTVFDYEFPVKAKTVLKAIDALSTNENERDEGDMFKRAGVVAIVCDSFLKQSKLGEILVTRNDEDFFYSFVFKHSLISPNNCMSLNNSFVSTSGYFGSARFAFCSLLNHSCAPNLIRVPSDSKMYIVIIRPIPVGGQLFHNYSHHHSFQILQKRQTQLKDDYKFKCSCEACKGNYPLYEEMYPTDPYFPRFVSYDFQVYNFEIARKNFKSYCDYLKKMDGEYPTMEIIAVQACFIQCFTTFSTSDFKLKLGEH